MARKNISSCSKASGLIEFHCKIKAAVAKKNTIELPKNVMLRSLQRALTSFCNIMKWLLALVQLEGQSVQELCQVTEMWESVALAHYSGYFVWKPVFVHHSCLSLSLWVWILSHWAVEDTLHRSVAYCKEPCLIRQTESKTGHWMHFCLVWRCDMYCLSSPSSS